jgi:hypothetical protein
MSGADRSVLVVSRLSPDSRTRASSSLRKNTVLVQEPEWASRRVLTVAEKLARLNKFLSAI